MHLPHTEECMFVLVGVQDTNKWGPSRKNTLLQSAADVVAFVPTGAMVKDFWNKGP